MTDRNGNPLTNIFTEGFSSDGTNHQWHGTIIPERIQEDILKLAFVGTNSPSSYPKLKVNLSIGNNTSSRVAVDDIAISFYPLDATDLNATPIGKCYRTKEEERGNIKTLEPKGSPGSGSFLIQNLDCNLPGDKPRSGKYKLVFKAKRNGVFQVFASSAVIVKSKSSSQELTFAKSTSPIPISKVIELENVNISSIINSLLGEDDKAAGIQIALIWPDIGLQFNSSDQNDPPPVCPSGYSEIDGGVRADTTNGGFVYSCLSNSPVSDVLTVLSTNICPTSLTVLEAFNLIGPPPSEVSRERAQISIQAAQAASNTLSWNHSTSFQAGTDDPMIISCTAIESN